MKNPLELIKNTKEDFEAVPDGEKEEYKESLQEVAAELNQIKNTADVKVVLENDVPEAAESFLNDVKNNVEKFPKYEKMFVEKPKEYDRMVDHREKEVFNAYYDKGDQKGAERMLEKTSNIFSKKGRVEKFENKFGEYKADWISKIKLKEYDQAEVESLVIYNTADFREALLMQDIDKAEEWLNALGVGTDKDKFDNFVGQRKADIEFIKKIIDSQKEK